MNRRSGHGEVGDRWLLKIWKGFELLLSYPHAGESVSRTYPNYRKLRIGVHVVFYRAGADHVRILRVFHQRQDPTLFLRRWVEDG